MPRRRNNFRFYAVLHGFGPPAPGIFSSWYVRIFPLQLSVLSRHAFFIYRYSLISAIRAEAQALTSQCSHSKCKGFEDLADARTYLSSNGLFESEWSEYIKGSPPRVGTPRAHDGAEREGKRYSVARGRTRGVYRNYLYVSYPLIGAKWIDGWVVRVEMKVLTGNSGGAEPEVVRYSSNCHKRFESAEEAEKFREEWRDIAFYVTHMRRMEDARGVEAGYW